MVIFANYKDNFDTATTAGSKFKNFDPNPIKLPITMMAIMAVIVIALITLHWL